MFFSVFIIFFRKKFDFANCKYLYSPGPLWILASIVAEWGTLVKVIVQFRVGRGWRSGLMVSALDYGASGPGSSPGRGHCVVFLSKTLYSHDASLHPGV